MPKNQIQPQSELPNGDVTFNDAPDDPFGAELPLPDSSMPVRIRWPGSVRQSNGWWVGAFGLSFGAVSFLYFLLYDQLKNHKKWALIAALLLPLLLWGLKVATQNVAAAYRRLDQYDSLYEVLLNRNHHLDNVKQQLSETELTVRQLLDQLISSRKVEIQRVQLFKGRVCLTLKLKKNQKVSVGDNVRVIDLNDGELMGTFEVTQARGTCIAEALKDINPVWSGYIHQTGSELPPPRTAAVLIVREQTEVST